MVEAFNFGKMAQNTKVIGKMTWLTAEVGLFTVMEMFMREFGLMTKLMVMEHTFIWMVLNILVPGLKINNMALV
jgi:hypothetical protein